MEQNYDFLIDPTMPTEIFYQSRYKRKRQKSSNDRQMDGHPGGVKRRKKSNRCPLQMRTAATAAATSHSGTEESCRQDTQRIQAISWNSEFSFKTKDEEDLSSSKTHPLIVGGRLSNSKSKSKSKAIKTGTKEVNFRKCPNNSIHGGLIQSHATPYSIVTSAPARLPRPKIIIISPTTKISHTPRKANSVAYWMQKNELLKIF